MPYLVLSLLSFLNCSPSGARQWRPLFLGQEGAGDEEQDDDAHWRFPDAPALIDETFSRLWLGGVRAFRRRRLLRREEGASPPPAAAAAAAAAGEPSRPDISPFLFSR